MSNHPSQLEPRRQGNYRALVEALAQLALAVAARRMPEQKRKAL